MSYCRISLLALAVLLGLLGGPVHAQVWNQGIALLQNDRCIEGRIERTGERYTITKAEGNQVSLPKGQVQYVGQNLIELYEFKRRGLPSNARGGDHFKLAQWCLRNQLLAQAGQHYLLLSQSHPPQSNPAVKRLGVEIKDAMLQQPAFRSHLGLAPVATQTWARSEPTGPPSSAQNQMDPAGGSSISLASADERQGDPRVLGQVQSQYVDHVQFILFNRCGQAGCHGIAAKNPFRLQPVGGVEANANSHKNMESVLKYVSRDPSARAALVDYATRAHGGRKSPAIATRETHLIQRIDQWIAFVRNPVVTAEAIGPSRSPNGLQLVQPGAPQYQPVPNQQLPNQTAPSAVSSGGQNTPSAAELDQLDAIITQQFAFPPKTKSSDPFDPAEFNRQRSDRRLQLPDPLRGVGTK